MGGCVNHTSIKLLKITQRKATAQESEALLTRNRVSPPHMQGVLPACTHSPFPVSFLKIQARLGGRQWAEFDLFCLFRPESRLITLDQMVTFKFPLMRSYIF